MAPTPSRRWPAICRATWRPRTRSPSRRSIPRSSTRSSSPASRQRPRSRFLPDGRLLVGELTGPVWVVQPGASQPDPVPLLDLGSAQLFGEQGLMDIELDPNFAHTGHLHVFYTKGFPGAHKRDRVSRFTMSGAAIAPGSEVVLWQDNVDAHAEHHGGALASGRTGDSTSPSGTTSTLRMRSVWTATTARSSGSTPTARSPPTIRSTTATARTGRRSGRLVCGTPSGCRSIA
jgi:glucose/arabinose dehydrogenase